MIEPIENSSEIPWPASGRRNASEETTAIASLTEGKAIRFPCRWNHHFGKSVTATDGNCNGVNTAHQTAKRNNFRVKASCILDPGDPDSGKRFVYVSWKESIKPKADHVVYDVDIKAFMPGGENYGNNG